MVPRYLGIDPALRTGWALLDARGACVSRGVWVNRAPGEGGKKENRQVRDQMRFGGFLHRVLSALREHPTVDRVAYEWVWRHSSTAQTQLYSGWRAILLACCAREKRGDWPVPWSVLRSTAYAHATAREVKAVKSLETTAARRKAGKALVVKCAERRWKIPGLTDDEADALWVAEACRLGRGGHNG